MKQQVFNPYLPSYEYIPDGEPHVFDDRLYVYGSHDLFNGHDFCLGDYVCYSAPVNDLSDWCFEGTIYRKDQDPKNSNGKMHMCAPDVARGTDGRYYLYYQLHELAITSVAVCDTPAGKYEFYGYVQHPDGTPWGMKKGDSFAFDPGVLLDDDGKPYLYVGFSPRPGLFKTILRLRGNSLEENVCLALEPDMKTVKGEEHPIIPGPVKAKGTAFEGHAFFEASSPRKIEGKYYMVYSSEQGHELCYATSDSPIGGFCYGGTIISNGDIGYQERKQACNYTGNNHGGMVLVNDQWYIFYHRQTNKQKCCRQGCAEKIFLLPDGSIPQVEMTSCGLNPVPLLGEGLYEARIASTLYSKQGTFSYDATREKDKKHIHPYFTQSGTDREENGDQYIANIKDGTMIGFKYFNFAKAVNISVCVRGNADGKMIVCAGEYALPLCEIKLSSSEKWTEFMSDKKLDLLGKQALFFKYQGSGSIDFQSFRLTP